MDTEEDKIQVKKVIKKSSIVMKTPDPLKETANKVDGELVQKVTVKKRRARGQKRSSKMSQEEEGLKDGDEDGDH